MFPKKLSGYLAIWLVAIFLAGCGNSENAYFNLKPISADEKVVVIEFSDLNCPACKNAHPIAREIRQIPGVHFEYRHFPLNIKGHETSRSAANAYECGVEQDYGSQWETTLFENQGKFTDEFFNSIPEKYGYVKDQNFNPTEYAACLSEERYKDKVQTDYRAALKAGVDSTPTFVVNGELVRGANGVKNAVEKALATATP